MASSLASHSSAFCSLLIKASSSISFSSREGAALYIFNQLYNCHINFGFPFSIFEKSDSIILFEKLGLCIDGLPLRGRSGCACGKPSATAGGGFYFTHPK